MSPRVQNWFGNIVSTPQQIVYPRSVEDIVSVVTDPGRYPAPIRAVGSNHSTTACGVAEGGTLLIMREMNRILDIGADTVTVQAGALYRDVAEELERHGFQFYVNVEIGSLTMGAAATCGTKEASFPGEHGQVNSYASRIRMVSASGALIDVDENEPELLQAVRSSYGLLGIVYEVTFRIKPLALMAVHHDTYALDEFERTLPQLLGSNESLMFYLDPFLDRITVERRHYLPRQALRSTGVSRWQWRVRNVFWRDIGPFYGHAFATLCPVRAIRDTAYGIFSRLAGLILKLLVRGNNTVATDQIIHYPPTGDDSRYTFSIWAYPERLYPRILREYFAFCKDYEDKHGYRANLLNVGYRIAHDDSSLFSYSFDENVMTCDPVSTGGPGWEAFLRAYNRFATEREGRPLFNQTKSLTPGQVHRAFGERLRRFELVRQRFDPGDRFLNAYFRVLLRPEGTDRDLIADEAHRG